MTRWSAFGVCTATAALLMLVLAVSLTRNAPEKARMSDAFVNSIGVSTHLKYRNTPYYTNYPLVKEKLAKLGVRHVRDAAFVSEDAQYNDVVYGRYRDLATLGIGFTLNASPKLGGLGTLERSDVESISEMSGPALEALEGPNEYNATNHEGKNPGWVQELTIYQRDLYVSVKNNPSTAGIPVLAPPLKKPYPRVKPDLSAYVDYANMHPYPGGRMPSAWGLDNYDIPSAREVGGAKPLMVTETGYHTTPEDTCRRTEVSESAMGKYLPRLFFEYFNRGIVRTYVYQLMDAEPDSPPDPVTGVDPDNPPDKDCGGYDWQKYFGLLRNDGTEKPAFQTLENTINILQDPGPTHATETLDYSLNGNTTDVSRTLLQDREGRFYLVLWQEVSSYDSRTKRDVAVPPEDVTLRVERPIRRAAIFLPNVSDEPVEVVGSRQTLNLSVPDAPLIVRLTPR